MLNESLDVLKIYSLSWFSQFYPPVHTFHNGISQHVNTYFFFMFLRPILRFSFSTLVRLSKKDTSGLLPFSIG